MLIGSSLNSDFGPLPSAPWNMEPPRLPLTGGGGGGSALPQSTNIQLSPTGMYHQHVLFSCSRSIMSKEIRTRFLNFFLQK